MIFKMTVPREKKNRDALLKDILDLPGVKEVGEDLEFIFKGDISLQKQVAELAYKYQVNAGWIG